MRLRISVKFEQVTPNGAVLHEQVYGSVVPNAVSADAESLSGIAALTIKEELPKFLAKSKGTH